MKWDTGTRYRCTRCGFEKFLPEDRMDPAQRPRTSCDECETLTAHEPTYQTYGTPSDFDQ